jgi:hypothetical protein
LATAYEKAKSQYHIAIQNNDTDLAHSKASECAVICRQLVKALPRKKEHFSLLSEQWEKIKEEISEKRKHRYQKQPMINPVNELKNP